MYHLKMLTRKEQQIIKAIQHGKDTLSTISKKTNTIFSGILIIIKVFEKNKWIKTIKAGRIRTIYLTPKGLQLQELFQEIEAPLTGKEQELLTGISTYENSINGLRRKIDITYAHLRKIIFNFIDRGYLKISKKGRNVSVELTHLGVAIQNNLLQVYTIINYKEEEHVKEEKSNALDNGRDLEAL